MRKPEMKIGVTILIVISLSSFFCIAANTEWCYQESATTSTECGGLSNGTYENVHPGLTQWKDGDWSTGDLVNTTTDVYIYFNYSKPANSNGANFQIKSSRNTSGVKSYSYGNLSITDSAEYAISPVQLRLHLNFTAPSTYRVSWGVLRPGSFWEETSLSGSEEAIAIEESIWWNITILDTVVTTPVIAPSLPYKNDDLVASTTYTNTNGSVGNVTFYWYKKGLHIYNQTFSNVATGTVQNMTLGKGNYTTNDTISVLVFANSTDMSLNKTSTIQIQSTNLSLTTPTINPAPAYDTSSLTASAYVYANNTNVNTTIIWYKNGVILYQVNETSAHTSASTSTISSVLGEANFTRFDLINVTFYSIDNRTHNTTIKKASINISNVIPSFSSATILPSPATAADNLTCENSTISDSDGDTLTLSYTWYKDGTIYANTEKILGAGNISVGETWYCKINATDGYNYSGAVQSSPVVIGSTNVAPSINSTNATRPDGLIANSTNPLNNNSQITLRALIYDSDTNDNHTIFFCKTNQFTGTACAGGEYCKSIINTTSYPEIICNYTVSPETSATIYYWAFALDNNSLYTGSGTAGQWVMNYPPTTPSLAGTMNSTWVNKNYALLSPTSSDPDSDTVIYSVYTNTTQGSMGLANKTLNSFNWTGLNETTYYWKVIANDSHGYESASSGIYQFYVDYTAPTLENDTISAESIYNTGSITIYIDCNDTNSGINQSSPTYTIITPSLNTYVQSLWLYRNVTYRDILDTSTTPPGTNPWPSGNYSLTTFTCSDMAGNIQTLTSIKSFIVSSPPSGSTTGGGGSTPDTSAIVNQTLEAIGYVCGNDKCETSLGESTLVCPNDCPIDFDRILTCLIRDPKECLYSEDWFISLMLIVLLGAGVYIFIISPRR